ncbi:peptidase S8/S53 domain-containing protein [Lactarius akahatsu]|uniref:Peptidase S8/S53 domain-containing protein n=1 Tax=Lactarius akahatsu TaxID=416441 RepID=A0AAD4Q5E0_9AGAM|nr:peptidase S8/S53 domain-containing protein [Lactarius akahatsu]
MHYYHCISVLSVLATGLLGGLAKPLSPPWDMHVKNSWNAVPRNWESPGHPPSGTTIDLYIALKPQRENAVVDALYEVSGPATQVPPLRCRYRAYLTKEQVAELVAPRPELVDPWLEHGTSSSSISRTHGGNTLKLKGVSVTQANTLLGASYQLYWHGSEVDIGRACDDAIEPRKSRFRHAVVPVLAVRHGNLYTTRSENVLGIVGFLGDYPSQADLTAFMQKYRSEADDATFTVVEVNGGGTGKGTSGTDNYLVSWLKYVLNQENIPQTISISMKSIPSRDNMIICNLCLGVRGVSVLVSGGNDGIGEGTCVRDDGTVRFEPPFPGTCPYVTVVGGTKDYEPEVVADFSAGGFSDYFKRPSYQEEAVSTFLQDLRNQYQGFSSLFASRFGRGIPVIATQAVRPPIFFNGSEQKEIGTSIAAPVVPGIISLLNDWLILTGREPLGFLNPWLYRRGFRGLVDITESSNPGCGTDGFSVIVGWDPHPLTRTSPQAHRIVLRAVHPDAHISTAKANNNRFGSPHCQLLHYKHPFALTHPFACVYLMDCVMGLLPDPCASLYNASLRHGPAPSILNLDNVGQSQQSRRTPRENCDCLYIGDDDDAAAGDPGGDAQIATLTRLLRVMNDPK